jgi:hypothetical protein
MGKEYGEDTIISSKNALGLYEIYPSGVNNKL